MFLCCCFFQIAGRKDLTNRPGVLLQPSPTPPPPPPSPTHTPNCSFTPEKCWFWIHEIWETPCYTAKISGVRGWGWGERTLGLFVKSFLPAFREKQHRNIFSHHTGRLARFGWILTYLKISVEMAVMWFLPEPFKWSTVSSSGRTSWKMTGSPLQKYKQFKHNVFVLDVDHYAEGAYKQWLRVPYFSMLIILFTFPSPFTKSYWIIACMRKSLSSLPS